MSTDEYSDGDYDQDTQPSVEVVAGGEAEGGKQPVEGGGSTAATEAATGAEAELLARLKRLVGMKQTRVKVRPAPAFLTCGNNF